MVDRYAVFGNPIEQSMSPQIHTQFAQAASQVIVYSRHCVEINEFETEAAKFFAAGGVGLNITAPFKLDAYQYANALSERARRAGAVNTLIRQADGEILGDNTDGAGLVHDIMHRNGWPIKAKNILILGAGGAVRGVLAPLLAELPAQIVIANRSVEKAGQLAAGFSSLGAISACGFDDIPAIEFDLIINATSVGLTGDVPLVPATLFSAKATRCYDMIYSADDTAFLAWVKSLGISQYSDGLGMLVGQAAESFFLWRGIRPEQEPVIKALRESLAKA